MQMLFLRESTHFENTKSIKNTPNFEKNFYKAQWSTQFYLGITNLYYSS